MSRIIILCVEDEREVLDALVRDLKPFTAAFAVEAAQSAGEALKVVDAALARGDQLGLVLADHVMPGMSGVDMLIRLNQQPATVNARKVLVTAQAGHQDTIRALNDANLDHYIPKPWSREELQSVVRRQLADYVIQNVDDLLPFMKVLDSPRLLEAIRKRGGRPD